MIRKRSKCSKVQCIGIEVWAIVASSCASSAATTDMQMGMTQRRSVMERRKETSRLRLLLLLVGRRTRRMWMRVTALLKAELKIWMLLSPFLDTRSKTIKIRILPLLIQSRLPYPPLLEQEDTPKEADANNCLNLRPLCRH